jgi:ferredoxin-NADP reductase/nitrite reductase/ring-hydroxylating ferredoxin subunit
MENVASFGSAITWYPIAASDDLPPRHTYQGKLLGHELAVWRADDGFVNVWEDRCLHRGVRLSLGLNDGAELKCQYHGWRYASRSAGCTYIPAHPAHAPARTICCNTFAAVERYGLIWSGEEPTGEVPDVPHLREGALVLRAISIHAPPALVGDRLRAHPDVMSADDRMVVMHSGDEQQPATIVLFVQPVDAGVTIVRGVRTPRPADVDVIPILRQHCAELSHLRDAIEAEAASMPAPPPMKPRQRSAVTVAPPTHTSGDTTRVAPLRVVVARKWAAAEDVAGFELESIAGPLPAFQPGAHIDVHLQNGLVRQYSLTNGPGEVVRYRIGVKLEPQSRGGSSALHATVREGDVLAISEPRNNFPLRRDHLNTVLIAGGIGVTPLLAMAQGLAHARLGFTLQYFAQTAAHVAFPEVLEKLGENVVFHLGLGPEATGDRLREIVADRRDSTQLYICGPGPMLTAGRTIARDLGWPDKDVHFEYFKNTSVIDDSSTFTVELARSALDVHVPAGITVLEALARRGVIVPSSCQQGACGTCLVRVLQGEPDHQDVYLNDSEKARNDRMLVCVSRAKSSHLVLDV